MSAVEGVTVRWEPGKAVTLCHPPIAGMPPHHVADPRAVGSLYLHSKHNLHTVQNLCRGQRTSGSMGLGQW